MKLEILNGPESGRIFELNLSEEVVFGRKTDLRLSFPYATMVSREHGRFFREGEKVFLVDGWLDGQPSKNGIVLQRANAAIELWGEQAEVSGGDIVIIANCIWLLLIE